MTAALKQVQPTLRELDLNVGVYSGEVADEVEYIKICPVRGQLGSLREFSRLRKLKAPIVTLLAWDGRRANCHSGLRRWCPQG